MKSNIIPFQSPEETLVGPCSVARLRIETVAGFGLADCLTLGWLFAWALVAGLECVLAARSIAI
jgi:hypothetical protein